LLIFFLLFFFSSRRRHTRFSRDWSSDVCSSDLYAPFYENISLTFSKQDLSDFTGLGSKFSLFCIRSKKSFCSLFNSLGVQTFTCTNRSPLPYPLRLVMPLPLNLRILPDCIPASNLILTLPPTASISFEVPKTASEILI